MISATSYERHAKSDGSIWIRVLPFEVVTTEPSRVIYTSCIVTPAVIVFCQLVI
jgi:ribosomal protein L16/L10AE